MQIDRFTQKMYKEIQKTKNHEGRVEEEGKKKTPRELLSVIKTY